jgi:hypothetical protein
MSDEEFEEYIANQEEPALLAIDQPLDEMSTTISDDMQSTEMVVEVSKDICTAIDATEVLLDIVQEDTSDNLPSIDITSVLEESVLTERGDAVTTTREDCIGSRSEAGSEDTNDNDLPPDESTTAIHDNTQPTGTVTAVMEEPHTIIEVNNVPLSILQIDSQPVAMETCDMADDSIWTQGSQQSGRARPGLGLVWSARRSPR